MLNEVRMRYPLTAGGQVVVHVETPSPLSARQLATLEHVARAVENYIDAWEANFRREANAAG